MARPDLNLLFALDVLLCEGSVARAGRRLRLSPSAMSRTLARLRETTGDPLLVRAGRGLVPTPRALALRDEVARIVREAEAVLRPAETVDPARLVRAFALRASDGFVENFGAALVARAGAEAPGVRLRFLPKPDKDSAPLREGAIDLDIGVVGAGAAPELRGSLLFRDRFVGVVRRDHPLAEGVVTPARYAAARHVRVSRRGIGGGPVDRALEAMGLERQVVATVGGFAAALALARAGDLVATVPERQTANLRDGLHAFALPLPAPPIAVAMLWHPRLDADPGHRWLRGCVRAVCGEG